jgi:hypothetical protein
MRSFRHSVVMMGLTALVAACAGCPPTTTAATAPAAGSPLAAGSPQAPGSPRTAACSPAVADAGTIQRAEPVGAPGMNGLLPQTLQTNFQMIANLMLAPLPANASSPLNQLLQSPDPKGQNALLLNDLIQCAVHPGKTWNYTGTLGQTTYPNPAFTLMKIPEDWTTQPLTPTSQYLVAACLATRLNSYGVQVPIFLSGSNVVAQQDGSTSYPYSEALWQATFVNQPEVVLPLAIDVWPSDQLMNGCINTKQLEAAIKARVCGSSTACGATIHDSPTDNIDKDCTMDPSTHYWKCHGTSVIETRLGLDTWQLIYGCAGCTAP